MNMYTLHFHQAKTPDKNSKRSVTKCTVTNDVETNSYTCPHSFTPLASQAYIPQRCGRDYSKDTGISCQRSAARLSNGAKPEETRLL